MFEICSEGLAKARSEAEWWKREADRALEPVPPDPPPVAQHPQEAAQDRELRELPEALRGAWRMYATKEGDGTVQKSDGRILYSVGATSMKDAKGDTRKFKSIKMKPTPFGDADFIITLEDGVIVWITPPSKRDNGLRSVIVSLGPKGGNLPFIPLVKVEAK